MKAVFRLLALVVSFAAGVAHGADTASIDQMLGKPDAPVTIIEYASLTCPHCAHFAETVIPKIKTDWVDTGKAKFLYRDFPTAPAELSVGASMIAQCAGPERYFGVLDLLFQTQEKWATAQSPLDEMKHVLRIAGMTPDQVDSCLTRQDLADAIQARAEDAAKKYGVDATPSLVINGKLFAGAQTYDEVDKELIKAYAAATAKKK
ncbi:MAG: DsbA family protein [Magnetospirillum sp.]|nr:DsbA family protein [Magnetospirillum sp.]